MSDKRKKIAKISGVALAILLVLVLALIGAVRNSERLQDRLVARAVTGLLSAPLATLGGDNIDVVFCGTGSPMGGGGPRGHSPSPQVPLVSLG